MIFEIRKIKQEIHSSIKACHKCSLPSLLEIWGEAKFWFE